MWLKVLVFFTARSLREGGYASIPSVFHQPAVSRPTTGRRTPDCRTPDRAALKLPLPSLSIVIPALDEEEPLRAYLPLALAEADEVIVADGGSRDGTRRVARELGARVVPGARGRGCQLNRGAMAACGDVLLFLHADTRLPPGGGNRARAAVAEGAVGGAFCLRFDAEGLVYRLGEAVVGFRSRRFRVPLGDQAQFATRGAFEQLGGFREWPILEDLDFFRRLKTLGPVRIVPQSVLTSARRFRELGPARTVARNWLILLLFSLGVSPHRLARLYRHNH